jgi:lipid-binding SYLF domain-containing protein
MKTQMETAVMHRAKYLSRLGLTIMFALLVSIFPRISMAATAAEINRDADIALEKLYKSTPAAKNMAEVAKGILVFPSIIKAGLVIGGQYGEGVLQVGGEPVGYYKSVAASYGLQAGAQSFGYALFFVDEESLQYLKASEGWEIGVGPTIVVVDAGVARSLSTSTAQSGIYAFFFNQKGLMAGIGIQGSKITQFEPGK